MPEKNLIQIIRQKIQKNIIIFITTAKIIEQQREVMNILILISKLGYLYVKQKSYIKKIQKFII